MTAENDSLRAATAGARLHAALQEHDVPGVRVVLRAWPDAVHWRDAEGCAALHRTRDPDLVRTLIDAGADIEARDDGGRTPLHRIQIAGGLEATRVLLERGARVDTRGVDGWTPLHTAAAFLHEPSVELLLAYGADPSARNRKGYTPLHEALEDGNVRTSRFLWNGPGERDVFASAGLGEVDYLTEMLELDPGLARAVDGSGRTPLHWAARCGEPAAAGVLLDHGADPDARDELEWTPMHWAAFGYPPAEDGPWGPRSYEVARLLVAAGAGLAPVDRRGKTPLDLLDRGHWEKPKLAALLGGAG